MDTNITKNETYETLSQREFDLYETILILRTPVQVFWSWGVEQMVNYYNKGLILLVNGHHHKGVVYIRLSWDDTYSYFLLNADLSVKKERHNVYFDELQEKVDKDVEYIDEYKY